MYEIACLEVENNLYAYNAVFSITEVTCLASTFHSHCKWDW